MRCLERALGADGLWLANESARAGAEPGSLADWSQKRSGLMRIYGSLNWTSRIRNDSSLKRLFKVDPVSLFLNHTPEVTEGIRIPEM